MLWAMKKQKFSRPGRVRVWLDNFRKTEWYGHQQSEDEKRMISSRVDINLYNTTSIQYNTAENGMNVRILFPDKIAENM